MKYNKDYTYIWLNSMGISSKATSNIESQLTDIRELWDLNNSNIYRLKGIKKNTKNKIINNRNETYQDKLKNILDSNLFKYITINNEKYPQKLKDIYDPPKVLYYKGELIKEEPSIAIVGSRKMTSYGKWATEKLVGDLCNLGITVISGLALGIDAIAHKTAIEARSRTVGVIGNGIDLIYPRKNKDLYKAIEKEGTIVSEYFLGAEPLPHHFPHRNRIISGLSSAVLVIEAKKKSGSLITAHHALDQGKDVFALPGNINSIFSEGTNLLIQDGAKMVLNVKDIIEEVREFRNLEHELNFEEMDIELSDLELKIFNAVKEKPITCDEISIRTKERISTVNSVLTILEIKGLVKEIAGSLFTLS